VLGDPVRRRILDLLADGDLTSGAVVNIVGTEFAISQSAVSQQLAVLRSSGFATVQAVGNRRIYSLDPTPLREVDAWVDRFRHLWNQPLDALHTEIARGKRARQEKE